MPTPTCSKPPLSGVVNINKPPGKTSRDVVDIVKRLVRPERTGHAGTLDPLATGVLVICVGAATRLIDYVQRAPKRYRATFQLGRSSPTEDIEGEITELPDAPRPSSDAIATAATRLVGQIMQRPPVYSALRVAGKRSYDLARAGRAVELAARPISVYAFDIIEYAYPQLIVDIRCGSGTYVRSLGRDLAESLGTAAVMSALERTEIGPFCVANAYSCNQLSLDNVTQWLRPMRDAAPGVRTMTLSAEQIATIAQGRFLDLSGTAEVDHQELAALDEAGELVAILKARGAGVFGPKLNLAPRPTSAR